MVHPAIKAGNTAVITGAGFGGIGYALASTFASHKMRLALIDISSSDLSKASSELKLPEDDILTIQADVSKYEDMLDAAKTVKQKFGDKGISVLCLNAGVGESETTTWNGKVDAWTKTLGVNLFGVINGSNAFTGSLVDSQNPGLVIVTGSKQGITAPPGTGAYYNVSKAGVKTFTERMAHELREATQKRVTAHLLVPGWTYTKLTKGNNSEKPAGAWEPQQVVDYALPRIEKGDFYIICPDNETSEQMDQARMEWSSSDVSQNRSALSRWDKEYKDEFEAFMKQRVG